MGHTGLTDQPETFVHRDAFVLSDDPSRLDLDFILDCLATTYWAGAEPRDRMQRALLASHVYGLYTPDGAPCGCVRILSDGVFNARISDLFLLPEHRGRGLGCWIVETLLHASRFKEVRRWQLVTEDAHTFYERFGFQVFPGDGKFMTLSRTTT
ncbi:MAG: GNAT family N-acetyltransferase [Pseudomonadota bacterium]